jgi:hypothetical protein
MDFDTIPKFRKKVREDDKFRKMPQSKYDGFFRCSDALDYDRAYLMNANNLTHLYEIVPKNKILWELFCYDVYKILAPFEHERPRHKKRFYDFGFISHEIIGIGLELAKAKTKNKMFDDCNAQKIILGKYSVAWDTHDHTRELRSEGKLLESFEWMTGPSVHKIQPCLSSSDIVVIELTVNKYIPCPESDIMNFEGCSQGYDVVAHTCALLFYPKASLYTILDPEGAVNSLFLTDLSSTIIQKVLGRGELKALQACEPFALLPHEQIGYSLQGVLEDPVTVESKKCIGFSGICQTVVPLALYATIRMEFTHPLLVGGAITYLLDQGKLDRVQLLVGFMSTLGKSLPKHWQKKKDIHDFQKFVYKNTELNYKEFDTDLVGTYYSARANAIHDRLAVPEPPSVLIPERKSIISTFLPFLPYL